MVDRVAWHGKTLDEHIALTQKWLGLNYQFVTLSVYGGDDQLYAAVVVRQETRSNNGRSRASVAISS